MGSFFHSTSLRFQAEFLRMYVPTCFLLRLARLVRAFVCACRVSCIAVVRSWNLTTVTAHVRLRRTLNPTSGKQETSWSATSPLLTWIRLLPRIHKTQSAIKTTTSLQKGCITIPAVAPSFKPLTNCPPGQEHQCSDRNAFNMGTLSTSQPMFCKLALLLLSLRRSNVCQEGRSKMRSQSWPLADSFSERSTPGDPHQLRGVHRQSVGSDSGALSRRGRGLGYDCS